MAAYYGVKTITSAPAESGVVTDGLVGYWDYYPGSGNVWYDLSGKNNNMRLYNSPTYNSGTDKSFTLSGSSQYGQVIWDHKNFPFGGGPFTLSCFLTIAAGSGLNLFGIGSNEWNGSRACLQGGTTYIGCETRNSGYTSATITTNTWYQIVYTFPAGAGTTIPVSYYLNGSLVSSTATNSVNVNVQQMDCCIGTIPGYPFTAWWNGKIGSPMLYNKALSAAEVTQNWNTLKGRYGLT